MSTRTGRLAAIAAGGAALVALLLASPGAPGPEGAGSRDGSAADTVELVTTTDVNPDTDGIVNETERARATFAGGCFWCMEPPYDELDGVISTTSGYAGGHVEDPSYEEVSSGGTGHREVMQVVYDPTTVSYTKLLEVFWHNVDPTDDGGQFCDRGYQYTTAVYYHNEEQKRLAERSKRRLAESEILDGAVETPIEPLEAFYPAEDYHQDYYQENPVRYKFYRWRCGRDDRLEELWGDRAGH